MGDAKPHKRIDKAAKDFVTEVDLASESVLKRSLAAATPDIGFYGEEGGGVPLDCRFGGAFGLGAEPETAGDAGVVEQGDHGHHGHEDDQQLEGHRVAVDGRLEDDELGVPAGGRGDAGQREQEERS